MSFISSPGTIGVEYELQIVDARTLDLADAVSLLVGRFPEERIKPELIQSTIEVTTPIGHGIADVAGALHASVTELRAACAQLGLRLCGGGTHPFCQRLGTITPQSRYLALAARSGLLGRRQMTSALQVHLGMASADEATVAMHELHCHLPSLLALSASSPYWRGYDTEFASWRHRILASARTYGPPPRFEQWAAVERFYRTGLRAAIFDSWRDIHWDIRPRPDFGTIEVRVMDSPPTPTEAMGLAAFVRALAIYLLRTPPDERPPLLPRPLPWWIERENQFEASRLALEARYVASAELAVVRPLREVIEATIDAIAPVAYELGDGDFLEPLWSRILSYPSYARQRQVGRMTGSCREVVAALARELDADLGVRELARMGRDEAQRG